MAAAEAVRAFCACAVTGDRRAVSQDGGGGIQAARGEEAFSVQPASQQRRGPGFGGPRGYHHHGPGIHAVRAGARGGVPMETRLRFARAQEPPWV